MKLFRALCIAVISTFCNCAYAQTYQYLPDTNAQWIMEQYSGGPQTNWYWIYYTNTDTTINSLRYTKLYSTIPQQLLPQARNGVYIGAYRNDTLGRIYFIQHDSIQEYRMFDFSKNAGDTINDIPAFCDPFSLCSPIMYRNGIVDSVNYVSRGSRIFKTLYLTLSGLGGGFKWMEGIGSPHSGFYPIFTQAFAGLYCMNHHDTIYYHGNYFSSNDYDYFEGTCDTIVVGISLDETAQDNVIEIYPTITSQDITLRFASLYDSKLNLQIFDALGQNCFSMKITATEFMGIDLTSLESGIYFLIVYDNNRILKSQRIIKQ